MTSGTAWDDTAPVPPSLALLQSRDLAGSYLGRPPECPPGSRYNYDNGLPSLMGSLIARTAGEPFDEFARHRLFTPLGITGYQWTHTACDGVLASGGLRLRPHDLAKIGQMMLDGGRWRSRQVVSEKWVGISTSQHTPDDDYPYGFYWHLTNSRQRHLSRYEGYLALGQGGQVLAVLPEPELVVVVASANWVRPAGKTPPFGSMPFRLINDFILPAVSDLAGN